MKTKTRALHWVLTALLAAGAAAQLACGEREIESGSAEIEVEKDVEAERESQAERELEQAGRQVERGVERGVEAVGRGIERGAENLERSFEEAAREIEPVAREVLDDAAVSARVKARLVADPDVNAFHIDVDTIDGRVTLSGKVARAFQREEAERVAQRTEGVREVVNLLQVVGER
jgi:osmotically-inducible protein OsmY